MKNYKDNDEDFKLVPMNISYNTDYSFMPMKKNPYKKMYTNNMHGNMIDPYHKPHLQNCCCMHNHQMMNNQQYYGNYHNKSMFMPNNMDDIMLKTLITVKKKSELFD